MSVRVGTDKVQKDGEVFKVKSVKNHPRFSPFSFNNDFSLLELEKEIELSPGVTEAIEIAAKADKIAEGTEALVSGWGRTQTRNETREILRGVVIPIVNQKECKDAYNGIVTVTNNMVCAGDFAKGGKDSR